MSELKMRGRYLAGAALGALMAFGAGQASAQDTSLSEVVVTGSRIRGVEAVGSNVVSINQEAIVQSGTSSAADLLRKVPQVIGLGPSATASSAQNGAANATRGSGVNLRGVGVNATLLLLNGKRFPAAGTQGQFTDPSVIPFLALERVEVVPDGASAIYGSDAIAGVVNLIIRKTFDGAQTNARVSYADGYETHQISQLLGTSWDSGAAMIAFEHSYNTELDARDRDFYTSDLRSRGGRDLRANQCNPGNIIISGVTYAIPAGGVTAANAASLVPATNLCDNLKYNYIIPEQQKNSVVLSARQDITDTISLFTEGYYSKRQVLNRNIITSSLTVPSTNPFYVRPPGAPAGTSESVNYSFFKDFGYNYVASGSASGEITAGADIKLPGEWKATAYASYGRSDDLNKQRSNYYGAGGVAALADTNPATALNLFGGANHPATIAKISSGQFIIQARTGLKTYNVQADGGLIDLPGGKVRLAVGAEYREEQLVTNLFGGAPGPATTSAYSNVTRNIGATFAELYVPLVGPDMNVPLVRRLDLSVAGRYEDYSDVGTTKNPKIGLNWELAEGVSFRGSYGKSFRAPSLAENSPIGGGAGLYGDTLPDPSSPTGTRQGIGIAGGNPNLQPETAKTWSFGLDLRPEPLPGFHANVTYFKVDYENQIVALRGTAGLLSLPFYAQFVIRNPTPAQIAALQAQYVTNTPINTALVTYIQDGRRHNLGTNIIRGFDFDLGYDWSTSLGDFETSVSGEYFTKFDLSPAPGAPITAVVDTINYPPELRMRGELAWRNNGWSARSAVNFTGAYKNNTITPAKKIDAFTTVDLHVSYDLSPRGGWFDGVTVALDAQNLFNKEPPFVDISGGYDPQMASPIGRLVGVSIDKRW
ncbi:TonB-dependent siderophore receptor [Phenylobacterium sp.]|uniref:TonB-dependent receptor plug domain-containing protein n=1 Tax=Phenylobacterium sp. TaxID=1871053 RepID=UPI00272287FF|nr:TonB-dependent receptor [Phenylobacterium sp.]MDO8799737.1 TonB-dependent receptor [Phenylobacterium sp.]